MGESMISTFGPLWIIASFILRVILGVKSVEDVVEDVRVANVRMIDVRGESRNAGGIIN